MVTLRKQDDQPTFYDSLDDTDQVRVIDAKSEVNITELKPRCLICNSNQMKEVDVFIQCQNCGNVINPALGDILQDESSLDLSSGRDPYAESNKPYIKSFSTDSASDYEFRNDSEKKVYRGSAQSALVEELQSFEQEQRQISNEQRRNNERKLADNDPFDQL